MNIPFAADCDDPVSCSTSANGNLRRLINTLTEALVREEMSSTTFLSPLELHVSLPAARIISYTREVRDYLMYADNLRAFRAGQNACYGLPDALYGYRVRVAPHQDAFIDVVAHTGAYRRGYIV